MPDIYSLALGLLHPFIAVFVLPDLLFNIRYSYDIAQVNGLFVLVAAVYLLFLSAFLQNNTPTFKTALANMYLSNVAWILLQMADFNYAVHRSTWGTIYLFTVILQSVLLFKV